MNKGAFIVGLGVWSFMEYSIHRFLLHGPLLKYHLPHHQKPEADHFDWKPSIVAGVLGGYIVYSAVHSHLHHGKKKLVSLRKLHDQHHHRPDRNFGVTTLLWDRVLGTDFNEKDTSLHM